MELLNRWMVMPALLFTALAVGQCGKKSNPVTPPPVATELQGTYSGSLSGNTVFDTTSWIFTFATDTVTVKHAVGQDTTVPINGVFSLDTAVTPNQITIHILHSSIYAVGSTDSAIFSLSGNVLKISANAPGTARPAALDGISAYYSLIQ
jgi:uncharacterized protein (TIGR03067 family)